MVIAGQAEFQFERLSGEQAALRRVALLVASGAPADALFAVVATQVAAVLDVPLASIVRYEPDGTAMERASVSPQGAMFPVGTRWSLDGTNVPAQVLETERPARIDDYAGLTGVIAETCRSVGIRSTVGIPIVVAARLWGAMVVSSTDPEPLPRNTEARLADFTELVAAAIANSEAREEVEQLADEQAALRRVATLVAQAVPSNELFAAVAKEVGALLGADFSGVIRYEDAATVAAVATWAASGEHPPVPDSWPVESGDPAALIAESRQPVRIEDWSAVPGPIAALLRTELEVRSSVGCPIVVDGRLWGALAVHSKQRVPLPLNIEARIQQFTDLAATALANADARGEVERLADEQAALRRVATLVARGTGPEPLFGAVADEVQALLEADISAIVRFDADGTAVVLGAHGGPYAAGTRVELSDHVVRAVRATGRAARFDANDPASAEMPDVIREVGLRSGLASPIVVSGEVWGAITVSWFARSLPPATERRLADFTELVATAVANSEARSEVERLADEQAALRRVATLVAEEAPQAEIFKAIAEEVASLLRTDEIRMLRYEGERSAIVVGVSGRQDTFPLGSQQILEGDTVAARVLSTGATERIEDYATPIGELADTARSIGVRSAVGAPILIEGRPWGAITAGSVGGVPLPPETEARLGQFTELMATAIANAEARAEVERLADEQAALRRVATLVAAGASPTALFDAVTGEMERVLGADAVTLSRYEPGGQVTFVAYHGFEQDPVAPGTRVRHEDGSVTAEVRRTGRPARIDGIDARSGPIAALARSVGVHSAVGTPIVVDGRLWGVIIASWTRAESPPADTEARMVQFAELLDIAIANADTRDQLTASRARLLTEADDARRRVVRDMHDGAQQRLVHSIITLRLAQGVLGEEDGEVASLVDEALEQVEQGNAELRELAHGILPSVLTRGGLRAGVDAVVARLELAVRVDVTAERFPAEIEASAYFIVAEALTNVVKHARAGRAEVRASVDDGTLHIEVRDDGVGGADTAGHGLVGLADRATALGGKLKVDSPPGGGTLLAATLPLPGR